MNRNPVPWVALREASKPVLTGFPLVDDGDNEPGDARLCLDGLIPWFAADKRLRRRSEVTGWSGIRPALRIRAFERDDIGHDLLAVGWECQTGGERRCTLVGRLEFRRPIESLRSIPALTVGRLSRPRLIIGGPAHWAERTTESGWQDYSALPCAW